MRLPRDAGKDAMDKKNQWDSIFVQIGCLKKKAVMQDTKQLLRYSEEAVANSILNMLKSQKKLAQASDKLQT